jgi:hypothetical protein
MYLGKKIRFEIKKAKPKRKRGKIILIGTGKIEKKKIEKIEEIKMKKKVVGRNKEKNRVEKKTEKEKEKKFGGREKG